MPVEQRSFLGLFDEDRQEEILRICAEQGRQVVDIVEGLEVSVVVPAEPKPEVKRLPGDPDLVKKVKTAASEAKRTGQRKNLQIPFGAGGWRVDSYSAGACRVMMTQVDPILKAAGEAGSGYPHKSLLRAVEILIEEDPRFAGEVEVDIHEKIEPNRLFNREPSDHLTFAVMTSISIRPVDKAS